MKKIDLSFLKHTELPTKDVKLKVNGEEQEFTIKAISNRGLTSIAAISPDDLDRSSKMCLLALMYGVDISQEQAISFMNFDITAADTLAGIILEFTNEYNKKLAEAKTEVKKNSKK